MWGSRVHNHKGQISGILLDHTPAHEAHFKCISKLTATPTTHLGYTEWRGHPDGHTGPQSHSQPVCRACLFLLPANFSIKIGSGTRLTLSVLRDALVANAELVFNDVLITVYVR